jgi:hypothetical protein
MRVVDAPTFAANSFYRVLVLHLNLASLKVCD